MMKKTIRFASYMLVLLGFGAAEGCGDDEKKDLCYECIDLNGETYDYCFAQYKSYYPGATKDDFINNYIADYIAQGYVCTKK